MNVENQGYYGGFMKGKGKAGCFSSEYISKQTEKDFEKMQKEYAFENSAIETTVQNYASTINLICSFCKKDFLELTGEDAEHYFHYLEQRIMDRDAPLSPRTVHTYKKNLNSVGEHFEAMQVFRKDGRSFQNPFSGKITKTETVKQAEREYKLLQQRESVRPVDVLRLLESVREDNISYYLILCMIAFCGVESHAVCEMRPAQLYLREINPPSLCFFIPVRKMAPKTKPVRNSRIDGSGKPDIPVNGDVKDTVQNALQDGSGSRNDQGKDWMQDISGELSYEKITAVFEDHGYRCSSLPGAYNQEFAAFYMEQKEELALRDFVFYNRNRNPVNFKTISSVLKKHKEILKIPYPLTTKELCGSLYGYFNS